jgi:hypothetical protein
VRISRVHFKDGELSEGNGGVIDCTSNLILESCIFSNNPTDFYSSIAIYLRNANVNLELYGCTVYGNQGNDAIYSNSTSTTRRYVFIGNIFYKNNYAYSVGSPTWAKYSFNVYTSFGVVLSPSNGLKPIAGGLAANLLTSIPPGYPAKDFYGAAITAPAAAGAIQETVTSTGYALSVSGAEIISGTPNADGLYSGSVTVQATPTEPNEVLWWEVSGVKVDEGKDNRTLTIQLDASKRVEPVFGVWISEGEKDDGSAGTLRWALDNNLSYVFKVREIQLDRPLSYTNEGISINGGGGGIVIMPSAVYEGGALLNFTATASLNGSYGVSFTNVHFKNTTSGVISVSGASSGTFYGQPNLRLYSCIFSENQGYVIYAGNDNVDVSLYGCTFYHNNAGAGGVLLNRGSRYNGLYESGSIYNYYYCDYSIYGCLFYDNVGTLFSFTNNEHSLYGLYIQGNVSDVTLAGSIGTQITNNQTFANLGISTTQPPFNTSTFKPNNPALKTGYYPSTTYDFYGNARNGTVGAVNY